MFSGMLRKNVCLFYIIKCVKEDEPSENANEL